MTAMIRTYNELKLLKTFESRYEYLKLNGIVGESIFGYDRYLNQLLYTSKRWRQIRKEIIIRDDGCNLGLKGYDIHGVVIVHHMNPITLEQIENDDPIIYNPNFLISSSDDTHKAIHYGVERLPSMICIERKPNDTIPWR